MTDNDRVAALTDLIELRVPVSAALAALQPFPWDSDELVTITRAHLAAVLEQFVAGSISSTDVVAWAESVHLRDDIAREEGAEDTVNEVLIEMSSPELFGDLAEIAPALLERLR